MLELWMLFAALAIFAFGGYAGFALCVFVDQREADRDAAFAAILSAMRTDTTFIEIDGTITASERSEIERDWYGDPPPSTTAADVAAQSDPAIFEIDGWSVASGPAEIEVVERVTDPERAMG